MRINKYFIYDIIGMAVYGLILYFGYIWLSGISPVYGYIWNCVLIIIALSFDGFTNKMLHSNETILLFREKYNYEKIFRMIVGGFISFKTLLYLFYMFILITSPIIDIKPTLLDKNIINFIQANNYSILFLIAFDTFIGQLSKDREKSKKIIERIENLSKNE